MHYASAIEQCNGKFWCVYVEEGVVCTESI